MCAVASVRFFSRWDHGVIRSMSAGEPVFFFFFFFFFFFKGKPHSLHVDHNHSHYMWGMFLRKSDVTIPASVTREWGSPSLGSPPPSSWLLLISFEETASLLWKGKLPSLTKTVVCRFWRVILCNRDFESGPLKSCHGRFFIFLNWEGAF